jgi:sulfur-oxidizing protein SoxZ
MRTIWFIAIGVFVGFFAFFILTTRDNPHTPVQKRELATAHDKVPTDKQPMKNYPTVPKVEDTQNVITLTQTTTEESITFQEQPMEDEDSDTEDIYQEEATGILLKKHTQIISKSKSLTLLNAQKIKMKIKAKEKGGIVKAKVAISHDMLTYLQAKKKGKQTHFITHITAKVGKRVVYDASTSQFLSKNPLIKFSFQGKKGETLTVLYQQLAGEVFYASKKIR